MTELQYEMNRMFPKAILPPEVEVLYDDPQHKYYYGTTTYRSATQIVEQFYEHFDTESKIIYMADKYNQSPEYWRTKWIEDNRTSLVRGGSIHDYQEQFLYNEGYSTVNNKRHIVRRLEDERLYKTNMSILPDGIYPELKLWRHDWRIAGRADKPTFETIQGVRYAHIEDYKTNKILHTQGYWDSKNPIPRKMLDPISHLDDCQMIHYTLQLSIYQYMLEYFGYKPGIRRIIHFPHPIEDLGTPSPVVHELPYLKDEVEAMLYHLMKTKWLNLTS